MGSTKQKSVQGEPLRQPLSDQLPNHQISSYQEILWAFQGHIPIAPSFKSLLCSFARNPDDLDTNQIAQLYFIRQERFLKANAYLVLFCGADLRLSAPYPSIVGTPRQPLGQHKRDAYSQEYPLASA